MKTEMATSPIMRPKATDNKVKSSCKIKVYGASKYGFVSDK